MTGAGLRLAVQACRLTPGFRTIAGRLRYVPPQCSTANSSVLPRRSGGTGLVPISVGAGSAARNRTLVIAPGRSAIVRTGGVITQNVDGLHSAAGSRRVINLHGDIASVVCLECGDRSARSELQSRLASANPQLEEPRVLEHAELRPDGDAVVQDWRQFRLVGCVHCGGRLKPDVVFFGESVPKPRVEAAYALMERARSWWYWARH